MQTELRAGLFPIQNVFSLNNNVQISITIRIQKDATKVTHWTRENQGVGGAFLLSWVQNTLPMNHEQLKNYNNRNTACMTLRRNRDSSITSTRIEKGFCNIELKIQLNRQFI